MVIYQEPNSTVYCGHTLEVLKQMPSNSVDMIMTSPPYWGLRTYKTVPIIWGDNHCEHEWGQELVKVSSGGKGYKQDTNVGTWFSNNSNFCLKCHAWKGELGLEPTIELYIEHLILIFNEVKRVLKKTGTCWVNLDDSYYGGGFGHEKDLTAEQFLKKYPKQGNNTGTCMDWQTRKMVGDTKRGNQLPPKSLCLIPQRFAIAMVNAGWILRNDICWNKPNPMPESVKDRFTGSWEHLFFFVKNKKYWFEQQFEELAYIDRRGSQRIAYSGKLSDVRDELNVQPVDYFGQPELGRNKRDVWEITTQPYPEAHFATFPEKLCETPILSGCPSMICKKCGKAREKIYEVQSRGGKSASNALEDYRRPENSCGTPSMKLLGYTDCGCNAGFEPGVVMDIFAGSGTTGAVAKRLGRKYIGIELNPEYCKLHKKRLQKISLPMEIAIA